MQDELVRGMRRQVLLRAAQEERDWGDRPETAAWFQEQADDLER